MDRFNNTKRRFLKMAKVASRVRAFKNRHSFICNNWTSIWGQTYSKWWRGEGRAGTSCKGYSKFRPHSPRNISDSRRKAQEPLVYVSLKKNNELFKRGKNLPNQRISDDAVNPFVSTSNSPAETVVNLPSVVIVKWEANQYFKLLS